MSRPRLRRGQRQAVRAFIRVLLGSSAVWGQRVVRVSGRPWSAHGGGSGGRNTAVSSAGADAGRSVRAGWNTRSSSASTQPLAVPDLPVQLAGGRPLPGRGSGRPGIPVGFAVAAATTGMTRVGYPRLLAGCRCEPAAAGVIRGMGVVAGSPAVGRGCRTGGRLWPVAGGGAASDDGDLLGAARPGRFGRRDRVGRVLRAGR